MARAPVALLVDDEAPVRELASTILQRAGFITLSACSAAEALSLSANREELINVLITDVQLGDGDGIELAKRIRRDRCGIEVLVISGVPDNGERAAANGYGFLEKPFHPTALLGSVQRCLARTISPQSERAEKDSGSNCA
jgi:two-component system, response regulator PdtaR